MTYRDRTYRPAAGSGQRHQRDGGGCRQEQDGQDGADHPDGSEQRHGAPIVDDDGAVPRGGRLEERVVVAVRGSLWRVIDPSSRYRVGS